MKLKHVTITGADDQIDPADLIKISNQYPFVEWGFLLSTSSVGTERFPTRSWINLFLKDLRPDIKVSFHLCGKLVRELLFGREEMGWDISHFIADNEGYNRRVQINSNLRRSKFDLPSFANRLRIIQRAYRHVVFITQAHSGNGDTLWKYLEKARIRHNILFDSSGGRGVSRLELIQQPIAGVLCGYAGGITPENINDILKQIDEKYQGFCWIDMESGIRSDNKFDLQKVTSILEQCKNYIL